MNPDQVQELANNLADLRAAVNQLAGASSLMANSFQRSVQGLSQVDPAFRNAANSLRDSVESTKQAGNAVQAEQLAAAQMMKRNSAEQQYATQQLVSSLRSLSGGLTSLNANMSNLSGGMGILGGAAQKAALGMNMNERAAQGLNNAITGFGNDVLRQADAYAGLKNALIKLGGAGEHTASSLYAYAKAAGLHMDSLNYMLAPLRALGTNILALGRGAGDAQKAFMEMLQVSSDQVERFARLGIMQEELMARQSDFVAQTSSAGLSFRLMGTDMASLRKASTEYVRNLYELSAITGESVDEQAKKQRAAVEERRLMMENLALQAQATRLRKEANEAEALGTPEGRQEAEDKRRQAALLERQASDQTRLIAALAKLPEETRVGIIQAMTTGGIGSEGAAMLARQGVLDDILKIVADQKAARERGEETDPERDAMRIKEIIAGAGLENAEALKTAMQLGGEDLAKAFGYDIPGIQFARDYAGRDMAGEQGELEQVRKRRAAAEEAGADRVSDTLAQLQGASIALNKMYNDFVAAGSPFIQAFDLVTNQATGAATALGKLGQAAVDTVNFFLSLPSMLAGVVDTGITKFQGVPQQGGSSTISQRPAVPIVTPPPPPPTEQGVTVAPEAQAPATAPTTAPEAQAPATAPTTAPETAPVATPEAQAPTTTPVTPGQTDQTVTPQATPLPNYPAVTVETNKGNRLTWPSNGVAKIANLIKDGKNRDQLRQELLKYIGKNSGYDNVTLDKIIDKSAQAANLPIPAGSTVPTTAVATAPTTAQPAAPEAQASTTTPTATPTVTPEAAPPVAAPVVQATPTATPPAVTAAPSTTAPPTTAPTTTPEAQVPATTTPVKPETTDRQRIPADIPAQQFTPSAELKAWIRSQIRRGVRRDKVREALLKQGYTAQQADAALTAELGNIPGTVQAQPAVVKPEAKPPQQTTGQQSRPPVAAQGTQERPTGAARPPVAPPKLTTPTDYNPETPDIDTVSPNDRLWKSKENELTSTLSDMLRNKKTLTRQQVNAVLDYFDNIKNKGGTPPTVNQIIEGSGALRQPTTATSQPTTMTGVSPEIAKTAEARVRRVKQVTPPSDIAQRANYLPTERGNITTDLESLVEAGVVKPEFLRGAGLQEPIGGDKNEETSDTQAQGAQLDPKLMKALAQLQMLSDSGVAPFTLSKITSLNDYHHNAEVPNSQHRKGRAVDFTIALPRGESKPTEKQFNDLQNFLKGTLGFDYVQNEYENPSPGSTGPHIHAHFNDPETLMGGSNFQMPTDVLQAAMGGIASGPKSGFPALLHGNEIIVPLDPNSILADLGKKSQEQIKTEMMTVEKSMSGEKIDPSIFRDISRQNQQIMEMIGYKLDNVINKLDMGNDTQSKILKYSQA